MFQPTTASTAFCNEGVDDTYTLKALAVGESLRHNLFFNHASGIVRSTTQQCGGPLVSLGDGLRHATPGTLVGPVFSDL